MVLFSMRGVSFSSFPPDNLDEVKKIPERLIWLQTSDDGIAGLG